MGWVRDFWDAFTGRAHRQRMREQQAAWDARFEHHRRELEAHREEVQRLMARAAERKAWDRTP